MLRTTCSQAAERANTAIAVSVRRVAPSSRFDTQKSRAEIATRPMIVPAAEATAGPSVKYVLRAARRPIVQIAVTMRQRRGEKNVDRQPDQEHAATEHEPADPVARCGDRPRPPFEQRRREQGLALQPRRVRAGAHAHAALPDGVLRNARLRPRASSGPGSVERNQACVTRRWGSSTLAAARSRRCLSCHAKLQRSPSSQR